MYLFFSSREVKSELQGPLSMHPPAEDNYGTDACALLCLQTTPPVLVVATPSGKLYHCVVLNKEEDAQVTIATKKFYTCFKLSLLPHYWESNP